jgi:hypothetical protein
MPDTNSTVGAFLTASRYAGDVLASPVVAAAWTRDSALARMTVGAVAGHLFLVVRRVDKHLDEPERVATIARGIASYGWLRVQAEDDLDRADHRTVRADGDHVADWGWEAVATAYAERVNKLGARLASRCPETVVLATGVMDFQAYLATRVVEVLVHADDLAVSVGVAPSDLPPDAATVAIELLVGAARSIHGDLEILRSLTRSERVSPRVPSVY